MEEEFKTSIITTRELKEDLEETGKYNIKDIKIQLLQLATQLYKLANELEEIKYVPVTSTTLVETPKSVPQEVREKLEYLRKLDIKEEKLKELIDKIFKRKKDGMLALSITQMNELLGEAAFGLLEEKKQQLDKLKAKALLDKLTTIESKQKEISPRIQEILNNLKKLKVKEEEMKQLNENITQASSVEKQLELLTDFLIRCSLLLKEQSVEVEEVERKEEDLKEQVEILRAELGKVKHLAASYFNRCRELEEDIKRIKTKNQEEIKLLKEKTKKEFLLKFIPVIDNIYHAYSQIKVNEQNKSIIDGLNLILKVIETFFQQEGVVPIECIGEKLNPKLHEVLDVVNTNEAEDDTIVEEIRKGYLHNQELLRPALVKVAKNIQIVEKGGTAREGQAKDE